MGEVPGALMLGEIGAVPGDVTLTQRVTAQQIVDAGPDRIEELRRSDSSYAVPRTTRLLSSRPLEPQAQTGPGAYGCSHPAGAEARSADARRSARSRRTAPDPVAISGSRRGRAGPGRRPGRSRSRPDRTRRPGAAGISAWPGGRAPRWWSARARSRPSRSRHRDHHRSTGRHRTFPDHLAPAVAADHGPPGTRGRRPRAGRRRNGVGIGEDPGGLGGTAARASAAPVEGRCNTRVVASRCGQTAVGFPLGAVHPMERQSRVRVASGSCIRSSQSSCQRHSSSNADCPAGSAPWRRSSSTVASSCQAGSAPEVTYLPWSPASYQPPVTSNRPSSRQPGYSRSASGPVQAGTAVSPVLGGTPT